MSSNMLENGAGWTAPVVTLRYVDKEEKSAPEAPPWTPEGEAEFGAQQWERVRRYAELYARRRLRGIGREADGAEEDVAQSALLLWWRSRTGGRKPLTARLAARNAWFRWLEGNGSKEWYAETEHFPERIGPFTNKRNAMRAARKVEQMVRAKQRTASKAPPALDWTWHYFALSAVRQQKRQPTAPLVRDLSDVAEDYCPDTAPALRYTLTRLASGDSCADVARALGANVKTVQKQVLRFVKSVPADLLQPVCNAERRPAPKLGDARQAGAPRREAEAYPCPSPTLTARTTDDTAPDLKVEPPVPGAVHWYTLQGTLYYWTDSLTAGNMRHVQTMPI